MRKSCKILAFILPILPWVWVMIPYMGGWISNDPWTALGLAILLMIPTVAALLGCGIAGVVCALRCWRQTGQKRYWIAFAFGAATFCSGVIWLFQLLIGM